MASTNPQEYPDYDLQELQFYAEEIEEIKGDLESLEYIPEKLKSRVEELSKRVRNHIIKRISQGQREAPRGGTDF